MSILNKDGKPYKVFSDPKPATPIIEPDKLVFHNFEWKNKTTISNQVLTPPEPPKPKSVKVDDFVQLLATSAKEIKQEAEKICEQEQKKEPKQELENIILVHCLSAHVHENKDELYDEVRKTIKYDNKFMFEAILLDTNGMEISLLTYCPDITVESIIYPSKYKTGEKLNHFRWWRIKHVEKKEDKFILYGELSETQYDFTA